MQYNPKDRREVRKLFNNIYVKNFPPEWNEAKLREIFGKYGEIKSLVVMQQKKIDGTTAPFAFVCYDKQGDKEYGPRCAMTAVNDLNEKQFGPY
jgi:RNA recognition motif-containing protein